MAFKSITLSAVIGLVSMNTQAASIWLEPTYQVIPSTSGTAVFELWADASDVGGILAGGLDLFYNTPDNIVSYNSDFAFDAAFPTDPFFNRTGDDCATDITLPGCSTIYEINGIAFGNFNGLAAAGPTLVGTLSFSSIGVVGITDLIMADNDFPAGSWYATDGSGPLIIEYGGAQIETPIPAAVWLFGSGLIGLIGITRRKKS